MKYAAIVFRNINLAAESVDYGAVVNALLTGGILLDEVVLLPYDDPAAVIKVLKRLDSECDGAFLICDEPLLSSAREAMNVVLGRTGETLFEGECLFAVLPAGQAGKQLVKELVVPAIDKRRGQSYRSVVIKTVSAPREQILKAVAHATDLAEGRLSLCTSEEFGVGRIEVIYNLNTPKMLSDDVVRILASELDQYVYAMEDVSVGRRLFEALKLHRLRLSTAESFTGGGVGEAIVANPGASQVFFEGINAYDNLAKRERLGVSEYTLHTKGAVSEEVAYEMAAGLLKDGHCDVAIATTGFAGPQSGGAGKPAGLCYIAIGTRERVRVYEYQLKGDREAITKQAINLALFLAYKEIN